MQKCCQEKTDDDEAIEWLECFMNDLKDIQEQINQMDSNQRKSSSSYKDVELLQLSKKNSSECVAS